jgi:hypothetical protein
MCITPALAADDIIALDLAQATATSDYKTSIDGSVQFYFGKSSHPAVIKSLGEEVSNKKANGFGRNSTRGCERAFLNAMLQFQEKAKKLGANAVINLNSFYNKKEAEIGTTVECHSGLLMDGVALKGEFVTIGK